MCNNTSMHWQRFNPIYRLSVTSPVSSMSPHFTVWVLRPRSRQWQMIKSICCPIYNSKWRSQCVRLTGCPNLIYVIRNSCTKAISHSQYCSEQFPLRTINARHARELIFKAHHIFNPEQRLAEIKRKEMPGSWSQIINQGKSKQSLCVKWYL